MKLCFNDMLYAFSYALDCVEHELLGVTTHHSERVACLCILMAKSLEYPTPQLLDLAGCCILHDNALTEYIKSEYQNGRALSDIQQNTDMSIHCRIGEKNISHLPFRSNITNVILYHHENADGSGPMGKRASEVPFFAELIHIADQTDSVFDLSKMDEQRYEAVLDFHNKTTGVLFTKKCTDLFRQSISYSQVMMLQDHTVGNFLKSLLPQVYESYDPSEIIRFTTLFARIIDYKSRFTKNHSLAIALKAFKMAEHYGFNEEKRSKLYFAGALHDIGKLVIEKDILEKPDKLTDQEFLQMKNHAWYTYKILSSIQGLEDITRWASLHHEKLDGSGYPFGFHAEQLSFEERLLAVLDIYQALIEERPYKKGLLHKDSIRILGTMTVRGLLDAAIVEDVDAVFQGVPAV